MMDFEETPARRPIDTLMALVDVVFLLLLFFLLAGNMEPPRETEIDVTLPKGVLDDRQERDTPMMLAIEADGFVWLGERVMDPELAGAMLKPEIERRNAERVSIHADAAAPAEAVLMLMEGLRETGVKQVTIVTEQGG